MILWIRIAILLVITLSNDKQNEMMGQIPSDSRYYASTSTYYQTYQG